MMKVDVSKDRNLYIGGSDIPAICGMGTMTPLEKYLEKKQQVTIKKTFEMTVGKRLEPVIRDLYLDSMLDANKSKPNKNPSDGWLFNDYSVVHQDYPFLKGHLDGYHTELNKVVEFKSSRYNIIELPIRYILQVAFYCMLTDAESADIAVLYNTHQFIVCPYQRNEKLEKMIMNKALEFWDRLKNNDPPAPRSPNDIKERNKQLYNKLNKNSMQLTVGLEKKLQDYVMMKEEYEGLNKSLSSLRMNVINEIESHDLVIDEKGETVVSYKFDKKGRDIIDKETLKIEYPSIWERVSKESTPSRKLFVKKGKL